MKFKMNNLEWTIKEATEEEIKKNFNDNNDTYYFGSITLSKQEILINKEVSKERQKMALYHELMHCYLYCFVTDNLNFEEEGFCDVSAKSHDIIHEIVKVYFKED